MILQFVACKKTAFNETTNNNFNTSLFFKNDKVLTFYQNLLFTKLKKQVASNNTTLQIPQNLGYPLWHKSLISLKPIAQSFTNTNEGDTLMAAYIPLTINGAYLSGLIKADELVDGTFTFRVMSNTEFYNVMHNQNAPANVQNNWLNIFLIMDYNSFGNKLFKNIPTTAFAANNIPSNITTVDILIDSVYAVHNLMLPVEQCYNVTYQGYHCGTPNNSLCIPHCDWATGCSVCWGMFFDMEVCYDVMIEMPGGGGGSTGGSSGGGGGSSPNPCGGGTVANPLEGTWYRPANGGCGGGGGFEPDQEPPMSPCEKIQFLLNPANVDDRQALINLKTNGNNFNYETGVTFRTIGGAPITMPLPGQIPPVISLENKGEIKYTNAIQRMMVHFHPNNAFLAALGIKTLPIFSPGDVISLAEIDGYKDASGRDLVNLNRFVLGMINSNGDAYFISIDDVEQFRNAMRDIVNDPVNKENFEESYEIKPNTNPIIYETQFLKWVKKKQLGISVLKANADFTSFSKLTLDNQNNVIPTPCN
ncbi:hypothetical protein ACFOWM_10910 [Ferruginibacter yonginensis]|uniref:Uncharacterized protein n=1 Tax=Ferruginibacter yonginensis TaxID=1310416 RepID=A0ABV8QUJ6_9BACT